MKLSTKLMLTLTLAFVAQISVLAAQQVPSQIDPLQGLNSDNWQTRASAYEFVKGNEELLKRPEAKTALLKLFEREGQLVNQVLEDSNGRFGVSVKYGEAYSEYFSDLKGFVEKLVDWHDPQQVCVLVFASFEPGSALSSKLAREGGEPVALCLLKLAQGKFFDRYEAIPTLMQLSSISSSLSPAVSRQIKEEIVSGLMDPNILVRQATVEASRDFGAPDLIPILQEIARSDPSSRMVDEGKRKSFFVREAATNAISSIQQRTGNK